MGIVFGDIFLLAWDCAVAITYRQNPELSIDQVLPLYRALNWSSAEKPKELLSALRNSHALVTAWNGELLVGLANAISDGHLVVYYPHLIVHPSFQRQGIGKELMQMLLIKYRGLHQQVLMSDAAAVSFYEKCGFRPAGGTQPMWIFAGREHG